MSVAAAVWRKTRHFGELVMFSHTLFSLPFALISLIWAAEGLPSLSVWIWSLVAIVAARNGANAFNRLADAEFDRLNPRTSHRHLPQNRLKSREVAWFVLINYSVFIGAAAMLNTLCFILSPVAIVLITSYSYTKRFTWLSHLYLGFVIASAPIGAWFAVTGQFAITPFILGTVVMLWIAGFDIIYATQDIDFDRKQGLWSIPGTFGMTPSLWISRLFHGTMLFLLAGLGFIRGAGWIYALGLGLTLILLLVEHGLVKPGSPRLMKIASYNLNQVISVIILTATMLDFFL